ncbi:hypothetical protein RSOLAG1IB_08086 [Rhizoctonia solani AG-1 IB]|uniref:Uncharacterized protein n=1 Tax=Thanatephorus cucumeris (strain AG1-IB / isolate 7/3/14) TaxID=1108050 RepID=A0A0B7FIM5_THACB|nr:hypothetical protein RSOLAG1IB_08086 [Rhizoctonia solani AG-1 IB]
MSNLANTNSYASDAPVAWFQDPNVPGNGPKTELASYIHQGETEQKGAGPVGVTWTPTNPNTGEPTSTATERSTLEILFPSQKPPAPIFHPNK